MKRFILILLMIAGPAFAVQPDEVLPDPILETRARLISKDLRCVVCRNESIDESNADIAKDLRLLVRERLVAGDSDPEVIEFIVARYGEYVLLKPQTGGSNLVLWASGPVMLLLALGMGGFYLRRRSKAPKRGEVPLTDEEKSRLDKIMQD